jgi:hypothetical protein
LDAAEGFGQLRHRALAQGQLTHHLAARGVSQGAEHRVERMGCL